MKHPRASLESHLREACAAFGIQTDYTDFSGKVARPPQQTLLRLLSSLSGRELKESRLEEGLREIIDESKIARLTRGLSPVYVLWQGSEDTRFSLSLPESLFQFIDRAVLQVFNHAKEPLFESRISLRYEKSTELHHSLYHQLSFEMPLSLKTGYYHLNLIVGPHESLALLIYAKTQIGKMSLANKREKHWGLFAPLYALRSKSSDGIGDINDLKVTSRWIRQLGGEFFGTLPLLASSFDEERPDPSPYSPLSRLFWNEIYLDLNELVNKTNSEDAKKTYQTMGSEGVDVNRASDLVQYREVYFRKKKVLDVLAQDFFRKGRTSEREFENFLLSYDEANSYADFRSGENPPQEKEFHLYCQFKMDQQMASVANDARRKVGSELYLDFPVGVSRSGFDHQIFNNSFLSTASAGAPPDLFYSGGQIWGFAPAHPIHTREEGYYYFIQCLRHHLRYAKYLRVDHIMQFHRIYAIPDGLKANEGTYLKYCAEEYFAILSVEAESAGAEIIGEDLGTVPKQVREDLAKHNCFGMWVLPFETKAEVAKAIQAAPSRSLACLNTHDMAPFHGYLQSRDLHLYDEFCVLDHEKDLKMEEERHEIVRDWYREFKIQFNDAQGLFEKIIKELAKGPSELLLINLEDLWLETEPQNVPGTWREYPNWQRKMRYPIEDWSQDQKILDLMSLITHLRKGT